MKSVRVERINSEIQKAISHIIDNDVRDPQIDAIISVSSVETTPDLSYCRVFITSIGQTSSDEVLARIKGAAGFIRGKLSKMVKVPFLSAEAKNISLWFLKPCALSEV